MNKIVLISGGLGDIGKAIAIAFGRQGIKVAISDLFEATSIASILDDMRRQGCGELIYNQVDVTSEKEVSQWLDAVTLKWGVPQIIIPNAGIVVAGSLTGDTLTTEQVEKQLNVNFWGSYHLAVQADWVLPGLEEGRFLTGEQSPQAICAWYRQRGAKLVVADPRRNLPRALIAGVLLVAVVYVTVNLTYLHALGVDGLARSAAPAADVMSRYFGPVGQRLIALGIAVSTFGFLNLVILVTPRVYQAMARDGLFFARFAELHPRFRTPVDAITVQGGWAIVLLVSGSYGALLDWVTFADWIFFGLTAATLVLIASAILVSLPSPKPPGGGCTSSPGR